MTNNTDQPSAPLYVTGCDRHYFLITLILLQAFKRWCPHQTLHICDFGMDETQKELLRSRTVLLEMPAKLSGASHPWIYKASLIDYVPTPPPSVIVWIDCDAFPVADIHKEVIKVITTPSPEKARIAICRGSKGSTWRRASPPENIAHFAMNPHHPYYNSGIWILSDTTLLHHWKETTEKSPRIGMFEQDAFNYLIFHHECMIHELDFHQWNVTHELLETMTVTPQGEWMQEEKPVFFAHITGIFKKQPVHAGAFDGFIRIPENRELAQLQIAHLRDFFSHQSGGG